MLKDTGALCVWCIREIKLSWVIEVFDDKITNDLAKHWFSQNLLNTVENQYKPCFGASLFTLGSSVLHIWFCILLWKWTLCSWHSEQVHSKSECASALQQCGYHPTFRTVLDLNDWSIRIIPLDGVAVSCQLPNNLKAYRLVTTNCYPQTFQSMRDNHNIWTKQYPCWNKVQCSRINKINV